jgi:hypothetical protein
MRRAWRPYHHATASRGFTPYFYTMVITAAFQTGSASAKKICHAPKGVAE